MAGNSFEKELRCRVKPDGWRHFKLIFSVLSTNESYQRPIRMLGCLNDVEASYLEKEKLRLLGMNDVLTGLLNRAGLDWKLREREKRGFLPGQDLLVLMDVDSFKNFNDQYGHQCGDDVLIQTGRLLREQFRLEDILCRWGGDEFLLYLVGAAGHTERIAKKFAVIQETMADYQYEGRKIPVTYSIGGTVVGDGSFEEDFKAADKSLYLVKERGRNGILLPPERS